MVCPVKPDTQVPRRPVALVATAIVVVAAAIVAALQMFGPRDAAETPPAEASVAVLPFADMSPDQDYGYFADGIQEELLAQLAVLDNLEVASRTSVEAYRETRLSVPAIADELGVAAIIEGSVRIDGDRVRITVQLIDGATDRHLWADNYDRALSMQTILEIQQDVAQQIANALNIETSGNRGAAVQLVTDNLEAYNYYLLGRHHTFRQTPEDLEIAVEYLQSAVDIDPEFALAYASLGWAYSFLGTNYGGRAPGDVYPQAKEAALKALALDSELGDARTLYADILTWYDWDFAAAEREYQKTLAVDPLNVLGYALFLSTQGRHEEAIAAIEQRLQVNGDDPYVRINAAWRFLTAGRPERAIAEAMHAPRHTDTNRVLAAAYLGLGQRDRAVTLYEKDLVEQGRNPQQLANLATIYFTIGRRDEAAALRDELLQLAAQAFVSPALIADVYFAAGEVDLGFEMLKQAVAVRTREVIFLRQDPSLNGLRNDPRYIALLEAIGLQ